RSRNAADPQRFSVRTRRRVLQIVRKQVRMQHPRRSHSRPQWTSRGRGDFQGVRDRGEGGQDNRVERRAEHEGSAFLTVTLIDSPVANVANIARALRTTGAELVVTRDPELIASAQKIVLPGVGSFVAAMRWLADARIDVALREAVERGATLLGICVGHQV